MDNSEILQKVYDVAPCYRPRNPWSYISQMFYGPQIRNYAKKSKKPIFGHVSSSKVAQLTAKQISWNEEKGDLAMHAVYIDEALKRINISEHFKMPVADAENIIINMVSQSARRNVSYLCNEPWMYSKLVGAIELIANEWKKEVKLNSLPPLNSRFDEEVLLCISKFSNIDSEARKFLSKSTIPGFR